MTQDAHSGPSDFEMGPLVDRDLPDALAALTEAFGGGFDSEWFEWKHRSNPVGRSPGWVARDDSGLIGLRLFLRWEFQAGGSIQSAVRPCDTVTVRRARGRGVFRGLTEYALGELGETADFVFNTPNEQSRPGYLKMGFVQWADVSQRAALTVPRQARLADIQPFREPYGSETTRTHLSSDFLDWRYRTCPRYEYALFGLAEADSANGIVCRVRRSGRFPLMVVSELWGSATQQKALVSATAHHLSTPLVWLGSDQSRFAGPGLKRAHTVVTRFDLGTRELLPPRFSVGDLEDVM